MTETMRIVVPFRPFAPESELHKSLPDFDWLAALQMVVATAARACKCPVNAITDVDTDLPVSSLKYRTTERRLMLWLLEVICCYVESDDFDRDTVILDVDQLIYGPLKPWFSEADLTVLVRTDEKHRASGQTLLNGVQWLSYAAKARLGRFYRLVLAGARQMSEASLQWGADTDALRDLLSPIGYGLHGRLGLAVQMLPAAGVLESFSTSHQRKLDRGEFFGPSVPVLDFRYMRKLAMADVYRDTFGGLL